MRLENINVVPAAIFMLNRTDVVALAIVISALYIPGISEELNILPFF